MSEPDLISPWMKEEDPLVVAVVGKLGEELSECAAACFRILIQGLNEVEPVTGKPNRQWLSEELADVAATMIRASDKLLLDEAFMSDRAARKSLGFERWDAMILKRERGVS